MYELDPLAMVAAGGSSCGQTPRERAHWRTEDVCYDRQLVEPPVFFERNVRNKLKTLLARCLVRHSRRQLDRRKAVCWRSITAVATENALRIKLTTTGWDF